MVEIPNAFGGFAPFPNTIMIPTMGLQSAVIGYRFGFGYEQGKRRLRSMSNEEFNTLDEEAEQAIFKRHDSAAINYFKTEMVQWIELQKIIIESSVEIEVMKAKRTPSALREMVGGFTQGLGEQEAGGIIPFKELKDFWDWIFSGQGQDPTKIETSIVKINPITGRPWSEETTTESPTVNLHRHTIEHHPIPKPRDKCQGLWDLWDIRQKAVTTLNNQFRLARNDVNNAAGNPRSSRYSSAINRSQTIKNQLTKAVTLLNAGINNPNNKDCATRWKIPR